MASPGFFARPKGHEIAILVMRTRKKFTQGRRTCRRGDGLKKHGTLFIDQITGGASGGAEKSQTTDSCEAEGRRRLIGPLESNERVFERARSHLRDGFS